MTDSDRRPGAMANGTRDQVPRISSRYSIVVYDDADIRSIDCEGIDQVIGQIHPDRVNWITIRDVHNEDELRRLLAVFDVDPFLVVEMLDERRMQFEIEYQNCIYLEYLVPYLNPHVRQLERSSGSFILGANFVILYENDLHGLFARTRRRVVGMQTRVQQNGPDYLLYLLLRAVIVEHFQESFRQMTGQLEVLEDNVLEGQGRESAYREILATREELKSWNEPLLEMEGFLEYVKDAESKFISAENARHFTKSLYREFESLLSYHDRMRGYLTEIMGLHMANIERRASRVTQLLTVIATVFLPITFIASIYGMNFEYMPELTKPWGYPAVLLLMASVAIGLLAFMKRRGWF